MTTVSAPALDPLDLGVKLSNGGVDVVVYAPRASRVDVCFFDGDRETSWTLLPSPNGTWNGQVPGIRAGAEYGFRVWGAWQPNEGLRHNPHKLLLDPYARGITGSVNHGEDLYDFAWEPGQRYPRTMSTTDSAPSMVRGVVLGTPFSAAHNKPQIPWDQTVIYEAHIKGITKLAPLVPAELRGTYAGLAHPSMIAHLKALGITSIELLPVQAFMSEPRLLDDSRSNYWGYNTLSYFAPEPSYASPSARARGAAAILDEFTGMIHLLHEAGIEVILDVVYNHTCEGGIAGPTLSWRGLDNPGYYLLGENGEHLDYTGCGNTLDFRHSSVVKLTLDSLRYWANLGVDGFRFDLAVSMGRHDDHFTPYHAFLSALATDPVLRKVKVIAEPWDLGPFGWRTGQFPAPFTEWNDRFRNTIRSFWLADAAAQSKGQAGNSSSDLGNRLTGSADLFGHGEIPGGRTPLASINYVTSHDGFTMRDLVSFDRKDNEANGENNRDGSNHNLSWNHGVEGLDFTADIMPVRRRSIRNLMGTLILSAGVPMITAGDEMGRTQRGNNNAYNQDNAISWVDWRLEPWQEDLSATTAYLLRLRRENAALRSTQFASGRPIDGDSLPDLSWYSADGEPKPAHNWHNPFERCLQMLRSGFPHGHDALMVLNSSLNPVTVTLPKGRGLNYTLVWDSEWEDPEPFFDTYMPGDEFLSEGLSLQLFLTAD
ncbi:MAG: glycogen debranching protein GlgX [Ruaniaceae bacterium]|nr:glycogen debranching protein GlgX [Ruaniaceae bacterium]